jgi:hypothetical protein
MQAEGRRLLRIWHAAARACAAVVFGRVVLRDRLARRAALDASRLIGRRQQTRSERAVKAAAEAAAADAIDTAATVGAEL